ncbi:MAG TPA: histidine phosphatase family protein [Candidatus Saccharibacteria bacterium]|nr:histidine phosphatase family protein [Candidatus Saccharibacteria bacterium]
MKHLYYCRHGLSVMNKQGLLAGSTDTPLHDEGREQARVAGQAAKQYRFDLIVASPMKRARETAEIIARECGYPIEKIVFDKRVVERHFGDLEGTPWHPGIDFGSNTTVEPHDIIMARAQSAKDWLDARPETNILLISHGAFIRAIRSLYLPNMPYADATANMPNAKIVKII